MVLSVLHLLKRDFTQPFIYLCGAFVIFYCVSWLVIAGGTPGIFVLSGKHFKVGETVFAQAGLQIGLSGLALLLGWVLAREVIPKAPESKTAPLDRIGVTRLTFSACVALAVPAVILLYFIRSSGGLETYWQEIPARARIFSGTPESAQLYALFVVGLLFAGFAAGALAANRGAPWAVVAIVVVAFGLAFLASGRFNMIKIFMAALVSYLSFHPRWRPSKAAIGLTFIVVAIASAVVLASRLDAAISEVPAEIFNSEITQANNLMIVLSDGSFGSQEGATISTGLLSFIPRTLLGEFGIEKGNSASAIFTLKHWPDRYLNTKSEIALGFVGELALNYHSFGIIVASVALSFSLEVANSVLRRAFWPRQLGRLLGGGVALWAFQVIRGSTYAATVDLFVYAAAACLFFAAFTAVRSEASRARPDGGIA